MVIDTHAHMLPLTIDTERISKVAAYCYNTYGPGARGGGVQVSLDEIKTRLESYVPDPHGEKLMERMSREGIDVTVLVVMDDLELGKNDNEILSDNRICADIAKGSKGKIISLAGVDPRRKNAPDLFRRCIEEYGMKGLKWHPDAGYYPNSPEAYAVLAVAENSSVTDFSSSSPSLKMFLR